LGYIVYAYNGMFECNLNKKKSKKGGRKRINKREMSQ